ncbi:hypothetical protein LCGC14_0603360 [marine sediment metagenome]|uniref:Uncharacterized protein n=1 Tax=marine sediment metagenome TaxID=412755 RepID=A0A0F9TW43_9ZZZZ
MPRKENINSRNIKFFEISTHNGDIETYFKSLGKWYVVSHMSGYINEVDEVSFKDMNIVISQTQDLNYHRIFGPSEVKKYKKTPSPIKAHVFYDTKMGNPNFFYGEDGEKKITARQIIQRYNKFSKEDF